MSCKMSFDLLSRSYSLLDEWKPSSFSWCKENNLIHHSKISKRYSIENRKSHHTIYLESINLEKPSHHFHPQSIQWAFILCGRRNYHTGRDKYYQNENVSSGKVWTQGHAHKTFKLQNRTVIQRQGQSYVTGQGRKQKNKYRIKTRIAM